MRTIGCGGSFAACNSAGGEFNAEPNQQPTNFPGTTPAAHADFVQPGMNQPSGCKASLALLDPPGRTTTGGSCASGSQVVSKSLPNASFAHVLDASETGQGGGDAVRLDLRQCRQRRRSAPAVDAQRQLDRGGGLDHAVDRPDLVEQGVEPGGGVTAQQRDAIELAADRRQLQQLGQLGQA
jgi:hypothetical protein